MKTNLINVLKHKGVVLVAATGLLANFALASTEYLDQCHTWEGSTISQTTWQLDDSYSMLSYLTAQSSYPQFYYKTKSVSKAFAPFWSYGYLQANESAAAQDCLTRNGAGKCGAQIAYQASQCTARLAKETKVFNDAVAIHKAVKIYFYAIFPWG